MENGSPEQDPTIKPESKAEATEIIENFHQKRIGIASAIGAKIRENGKVNEVISAVEDQIKKHPDAARFASTAFNATIGSYITMSMELAAGKTATGYEFTKLGSIFQAISISSGLYQYHLLFVQHDLVGTAIARGISWATFSAMYFSDAVSPLFKGFSKVVEKSNPKGAEFLLAVAKNCDKPKKLFFKPKKDESGP